MISAIPPGDCDPRYDEPEYECDKCSDLLEQDLLDEWFCPTCLKKEMETENGPK